jgi:hypothetical protein
MKKEWEKHLSNLKNCVRIFQYENSYKYFHPYSYEDMGLISKRR